MLVKSSLIYCLFDFFLKIKYNLPMIIAIVDSLFLFFIFKRMRIFCHRIKPWFYRAVNPIIRSLMCDRAPCQFDLFINKIKLYTNINICQTHFHLLRKTIELFFVCFCFMWFWGLENIITLYE